jgi:ribose 5-phosphate isomerase B
MLAVKRVVDTDFWNDSKVSDIFSAEVTRKHNDTNVIALGARISTKEDVIKFIDKFLNTGFEGGRHQNRVNKVNELDK